MGVQPPLLQESRQVPAAAPCLIGADSLRERPHSRAAPFAFESRKSIDLSDPEGALDGGFGAARLRRWPSRPPAGRREHRRATSRDPPPPVGAELRARGGAGSPVRGVGGHSTQRSPTPRTG